MTKKILIYQSYYIPWRGYFDMINMVDEFIVYDAMQFSRSGYYNRNQIKTPSGKLWLTIPVENKGHIANNQSIYDTKVVNQLWRQKHWRSIIANYSKTPYFKQYKDIFENLYLNSNSEYLSDINKEFFKVIFDILGIKTKISDCKDYELVGDRNERLINLIKQAGGNYYLSSPVAKNYMDLSLFEKADISVEFMSYDGYLDYPQVFPPFDAGVSILDLIFNTGNDAHLFMKGFKK